MLAESRVKDSPNENSIMVLLNNNKVQYIKDLQGVPQIVPKRSNRIQDKIIRTFVD